MSRRPSTRLQRRQIGARGSLAKLHWSEAHQRFAALALELLAQASLPPLRPCNWRAGASRRFYCRRGPRPSTLAPPKIQLGIIADRILQLSKGK
jgi:hypothetical protein